MTKYLSLISGALLTIFYMLFRKRGERIAELETNNETIRTQTELKQLDKESQDARNNSQGLFNTYTTLVNNDPELAKRLGIGPYAGRNEKND